MKLGGWVANQRINRDAKSAERKQRLDAIGFVWGPYESAWEEGFAALKVFKAREGHCRVPTAHKEGAFKLGSWVGRQRGNRDATPAEHGQRLDSIGFVWDLYKSDWEDGFGALTAFKIREGHCRVSDKHVEGTFRLGSWVRNQRVRRETIPTERKQRLVAIGFVWRVKQ